MRVEYGFGDDSPELMGRKRSRRKAAGTAAAFALGPAGLIALAAKRRKKRKLSKGAKVAAGLALAPAAALIPGVGIALAIRRRRKKRLAAAKAKAIEAAATGKVDVPAEEIPPSARTQQDEGQQDEGQQPADAGAEPTKKSALAKAAIPAGLLGLAFLLGV